MAPHILVVDDVVSTLRALEAILAQEGYTVTTTTSGEDAASLMRRLREELYYHLNVIAIDLPAFRE